MRELPWECRISNCHKRNCPSAPKVKEEFLRMIILGKERRDGREGLTIAPRRKKDSLCDDSFCDDSSQEMKSPELVHQNDSINIITRKLIDINLIEIYPEKWLKYINQIDLFYTVT